MILLTEITEDSAESLSTVFTCILDTLGLDLIDSHAFERMRSSEILDVVIGNSVLKVEVTEVKTYNIEASLRKSESKFPFYLSGVEGKIPPLRKNFLLI